MKKMMINFCIIKTDDTLLTILKLLSRLTPENWYYGVHNEETSQGIDLG